MGREGSFSVSGYSEICIVIKRKGGTMISNQILQNTITGLKGISRVDFAVVDIEGNNVVTTLDDERG